MFTFLVGLTFDSKKRFEDANTKPKILIFFNLKDRTKKMSLPACLQLQKCRSTIFIVLLFGLDSLELQMFLKTA